MWPWWRNGKWMRQSEQGPVEPEKDQDSSEHDSESNPKDTARKKVV